MREHGFSLVELVIVIAIIGILLAIAVPNWNQMQTKSAIETEIKQLYADLTQVRLQALSTQRPISVAISGQTFNTYSSAVDTVPPVVTKQLRYPVTSDVAGTLTFDSHGLVQSLTFGADRSICVNIASSAAVDSLVVTQAQFSLGKLTGGVCASGNISR